MRWVITTLALALCLLGCGLAPEPAASGEPIQLMEWGDVGCGDEWTEGLLLVDQTYATAISVMPRPIAPFQDAVWPSPNNGSTILPVRWHRGFTALRLAGGEVAVLDHAGNHVVTTGRKYKLKGNWVLGNSAGDLVGPPHVDQFVACGDAGTVIATWW